MKEARLGATPDMWGSSTRATRAVSSREKWFQEARFAMFIHWGLYAELAGRWKGETYHGIGEWIQHQARIPAAEYAKTARRFNPAAFDPRAWVRLAKEAGMRYIVITAKHHDGFAMFKSNASPFNSVDGSPFKRDPLRMLADACREEGLRLGFYYSQTQDWHEPDAAGNFWNGFKAGEHGFRNYLERKALPQIEELLTNYGPVALIWFDTPGPINRADSASLMRKIRRLQPGCLVNSRIGNGLGDYETIGDQEIPRHPRKGLWETIDTHNDTWGFVRHDVNWKSPREIAERLVKVVSRGGNYMLNIGPDGTGRVPELSARILREVGRWLARHGEAIYGAMPSPLPAAPWGECTARGGTLYLHILQWPADGRLLVPGLGSGATSAKLLGVDSKKSLPLQRHRGYLEIRLPLAPPPVLIPVVAVRIEGAVTSSMRQVVLNGCVNSLPSLSAKLSGCRHDKLSWMEKFGDWKHVECVSGWEVGKKGAAWEFSTVEPGDFYVDIEYACPLESDHSEWRMRVDELDVSFPLLATGHNPDRKGRMRGLFLARFRAYRIGMFALSAGRHVISISPQTKDGSGIHIATLTLQGCGVRSR